MEIFSVDRIIYHLNEWGQYVCMTLKLCVFVDVVILYPPVPMLGKSNKLLKKYIFKLTAVYIMFLLLIEWRSTG